MPNDISLKKEIQRKLIHFGSGIIPVLVLIYGREFILPILGISTLLFIIVDYLKSNINKALAIPYLEKALSNPKTKPDALFELALAYHYSDDFIRALDLYAKYKKNGKGSKQDLVDRKIEMCEKRLLL